MPYTVKRCKVCNQLVNVRKKGSCYSLRNCCEHIPSHVRENAKEIDIKKYFVN